MIAPVTVFVCYGFNTAGKMYTILTMVNIEKKLDIFPQLTNINEIDFLYQSARGEYYDRHSHEQS
jgi:hypothetical protein